MAKKHRTQLNYQVGPEPDACSKCAQKKSREDLFDFSLSVQKRVCRSCFMKLFELLGPHAVGSAITDRVKVNILDRASSTVITIHITKRIPNETTSAPETSVREFGHIILSG
jgi:hypothetical protein